MEKEYMKLKEASEYLQISTKTMSNWIYERRLKIPIYKVGGCYRLLRSDLDKLFVRVNDEEV